jgi:hypothetical protein
MESERNAVCFRILSSFRNTSLLYGCVCTSHILQYYFVALPMHFQIMIKERPTKCIFKVNHIFITILLLHVSALQERHLQRAQRILM